MSVEAVYNERDLPGVVLARAIRRNIVAGALGSVYVMIVIGFFRAGFARALGLSNLQFGFMSSIPMLVFPVRLLASFIVEHLGHRKRFFTITTMGSRLVWVAILCLPFVLTDVSKFRSTLFLMLLLVSSSLGAMAGPAWFSWLGDLIPENMRARFWARRSLYVSLSGVVPTVLLALTKDTLSRRGDVGSEFTGFAVVFGFAVFCGAVDLVVHYAIPEPQMSKHKYESQHLKALLEPAKDRQFKPFLVFNGAWTFALMLMGAFGFKYFFEMAEGKSFYFSIGPLSVVVGEFTTIALISMLSVATGAIGYPVWGMLIQRYGNKPVLQLCTLLACFTPLPWLLITPEHPYWPTMIAYSLGGLTFSGVNVSRMNLMYGLSPRQNRSMYIAMNMTVIGLCGALAPILAGVFMQYAAASELPGHNAFSLLIIDTVLKLKGFPILCIKSVLRLNGFCLLCLATAMVRFYTRMLLYRVREGENVTPGYVLRRLTEANPFRVFSSIYALSVPATEERKLSAVSRLGDAASKLATRDLVEHLDDPSPRVREEAAQALAKSKDPEAVDALIKKLGSREHGLELQSARALGQIGDQRGVQPLIDSLANPDPRMRASAAQALGDIGDRRASEPLFGLLKGDQDELTFGSYATALSALGEISAIWHILPVMRNTRSVVFRRQLAVAIGNLLGQAKVFYGYLDEECKVFGQRVGKIFNRCRRLVSRRQNNPLYDFRNVLLELMAEAETAYLREDWTDCAIKIAAATEIVTEAVFNVMAAAGALPPQPAGQTLDKFEKIFLIIARNEQLGMQLWYSGVLSREEDPEFEKLTFEGCLLDVYVLQLAVGTVLPRRPARTDQAGEGIGQ